jgi:hypothetical protein
VTKPNITGKTCYNSSKLRYEEKVKLPNKLNLFIVSLQQKNCLTKNKEALYDKGKALNMQYLALINQY